MAIRPIFISTEQTGFVFKQNFEFEYFSGFSKTQKLKCIHSLHENFKNEYPNKKILEISSKSEYELGVKLSAFNIIIPRKNGHSFSVESAFQASKVFEFGGPYTDLLFVPSKSAKKDARLKTSGKVIGFKYFGRNFPILPKTYFYNWLYINSLNLYPDLCEQILDFDAFSDIEFNPNKSINCQAEAAAIYVSLSRLGFLKEALKDKNSFLEVVYPNYIYDKNDIILNIESDNSSNQQLSFLE